MRVLVLEDDADQRRLLTLIVRSCGHEVIGCASLAAARTAAPWDLALIDRRLPDGDGLDWARELMAATRENDTGRRVYLLTGEEQSDIDVPMLLKPVRARELERLLQ